MRLGAISSIEEMCCFGRDKERRCAHCGAVVEDPRSLLFYGTVADFCDLQCQRRFVAEYWVRPVSGQPQKATEEKPAHGPR